MTFLKTSIQKLREKKTRRVRAVRWTVGSPQRPMGAQSAPQAA